MSARPRPALQPESGRTDMLDDVVRRAQGGDVAAFETLYRDNVRTVFALCRRMIGNDQDARELVQDVFVRAWERLPSFQGHSALATWLHRLAVNVVLNRMRTTKRFAARFEHDDIAVAHATSGDVDVAGQMDLDNAMQALPDGARTVFVLHDIEGFSHDEIAEMTGIAAATSRVQLYRARRALMQRLDR